MLNHIFAHLASGHRHHNQSLVVALVLELCPRLGRGHPSAVALFGVAVADEERLVANIHNYGIVDVAGHCGGNAAFGIIHKVGKDITFKKVAHSDIVAVNLAICFGGQIHGTLMTAYLMAEIHTLHIITSAALFYPHANIGLALRTGPVHQAGN